MGQTHAWLRRGRGRDGLTVPQTQDLIRDAATLIVIRDPGGSTPSVLMGQRGAGATFMPGKFVFPGGAADTVDATVALARDLPRVCAGRVGRTDLAATAIRELWEETGLILGRPGRWPAAPPRGWRGFAATGHLPDAGALSFVFRAITPPGRPRRFDARFFLADASALAGDPDDFARAEDELNHLQWIPVEETFRFDLPFVTQCVLAEVAARLPATGAPDAVPFFRNDDEESLFLRIHGRPLTD
jgi:8-oxo-dGTP pyrophosphatase MutT (NUDIX family)